MARAFIFPGQGSQQLGMGKDLADAFSVAREVFEEVDDALSQKLSSVMWGEDKDALTQTTNTQPALMAHSIAAMRVLESEQGISLEEDAMFVAGHSLGEYSALCAAKAISLADTARLLRIRGEAMQAAVPAGKGAMAALIGVDIETVEKALEDVKSEGICEIANDNAPGQVVVSGEGAAIDAICANAKSFGAKIAKKLPVSAPFHCSLMAPAAQKMEAALAAASIDSPVPALIANVTAREALDADDIRALLVRQVTGQVRWTESAQYMSGAGVDSFVEVGTGKVLCGLIKRIAKDAQLQTIGTAADIEAYQK